MVTKEELKDKVLDRYEDLKLLYGFESESDKLKINETLRDEFAEDIYSDILIELGINEDIEDLEVEDPDSKEKSIDDDDKENYDKLIRTFLVTQKDVFETEMKLKGYDKEGKVWVQRRLPLLPSDDITMIIEFIQDNFLPQSLVSKLKTKETQFDDSMNLFCHKILESIADYSDDIVSSKEVKSVMNLIVSKILVVKRAIQSGRLGDLLRDMIIKSYNEKAEVEKEKKDLLKQSLGFTD